MKRRQVIETPATITTQVDKDNNEISFSNETYRTIKKRKTARDPESSPSSASDADDRSSSDSTFSDSWGSDSDNPSELSLDEQSADNNDITAGASVKRKMEEEIVLGDLDNFWSKVAAKARRELGSLKEHLNEDRSSLETLKTRCSIVEHLMALPLVLSVGFNKEDSKFSVFVSDCKKAVELSKELADPGIELVEARNSHFF